MRGTEEEMNLKWTIPYLLLGLSLFSVKIIADRKTAKALERIADASEAMAFDYHK